jgi:hypothetical protein
VDEVRIPSLPRRRPPRSCSRASTRKAGTRRRAAEAEANKKGEPLATPAVECVPYGFPRMMSVALYPIEILPSAKQVTIITEAFSEVRRVYMGEKQQPIDEVPPGYYGHSVGTLGRRHAGDRHRRDQGVDRCLPEPAA